MNSHPLRRQRHCLRRHNLRKHYGWWRVSATSILKVPCPTNIANTCGRSWWNICVHQNSEFDGLNLAWIWRVPMSDMRLIVAGAGGRMGRTLINAIAATDGLTLAGAIEASGSSIIGRDAGE